MHRLFVAALIVAAAPAVAATDSLVLSPSQLDQLTHLQSGTSIVLGGFPDGRGSTASLSFERLDVYAPGARVVVVDASGEHDVPRSERIHLLGADASNTLRASLAFDPGFDHVTGIASTPSGTFAIGAQHDERGTHIQVIPMQETLPPGVVPEMVAGDDALPSGNAPPSALAIALAAMAPAAAPRGAVVAIDTDTEFLLKRFSSNTSAATSWIADLFAAMNVMYQRDLNVTLQQGTTYLRTTSDPYSVTSSPADSTNLSEFGTYWQANYPTVPRTFAALLSGKAETPNNASGIAWINSYCHNQSQGGSYSVTQVFTNPQLNVGLSALIAGHEIGHNFGAYHTHCTNLTTGALTATNTIDKCYSGETGCYSGPTTCPTSGPGAPAGTVMSYCNSIGCGTGGQNVLQFHPTQITTLSALIAQNTPSCLAANADQIFKNGFDG
ncbi:MAG: M12 family metallo-peptidase [Dokdonella sp.]